MVTKGAIALPGTANLNDNVVVCGVQLKVVSPECSSSRHISSVLFVCMLTAVLPAPHIGMPKSNRNRHVQCTRSTCAHMDAPMRTRTWHTQPSPQVIQVHCSPGSGRFDGAHPRMQEPRVDGTTSDLQEMWSGNGPASGGWNISARGKQQAAPRLQRPSRAHAARSTGPANQAVCSRTARGSACPAAETWARTAACMVSKAPKGKGKALMLPPCHAAFQPPSLGAGKPGSAIGLPTPGHTYLSSIRKLLAFTLGSTSALMTNGSGRAWMPFISTCGSGSTQTSVPYGAVSITQNPAAPSTRGAGMQGPVRLA